MAIFALNPAGDPTNPNDYTLEAKPTCPNGTNKICSIDAANDGTDKPVLTSALKDSMIRALHNRTSNAPTVVLKS